MRNMKNFLMTFKENYTHYSSEIFVIAYSLVTVGKNK